MIQLETFEIVLYLWNSLEHTFRLLFVVVSMLKKDKMLLLKSHCFSLSLGHYKCTKQYISNIVIGQVQLWPRYH